MATMTSTMVKAVRAASAARMASAAARRRQIAQLRAVLQMHKVQNQHRREQVSTGLALLRGRCAALRSQIRQRLQLGRARGNAAETIANDPLQTRILDLLAAHHRGLRAQEIGNELGIDWRTVAPLMSGLVEKGLVDSIDREFYLAGKAS
jgi:DNA-binding NarL/FixJ family response regulator